MMSGLRDKQTWGQADVLFLSYALSRAQKHTHKHKLFDTNFHDIIKSFFQLRMSSTTTELRTSVSSTRTVSSSPCPVWGIWGRWASAWRSVSWCMAPATSRFAAAQSRTTSSTLPAVKQKPTDEWCCGCRQNSVQWPVQNAFVFLKGNNILSTQNPRHKCKRSSKQSSSHGFQWKRRDEECLTAFWKWSMNPVNADNCEARTISAQDLSDSQKGAGLGNGFSSATPPVNRNLHSSSTIFPL